MGKLQGFSILLSTVKCAGHWALLFSKHSKWFGPYSLVRRAWLPALGLQARPSLPSLSTAAICRMCMPPITVSAVIVDYCCHMPLSHLLDVLGNQCTTPAPHGELPCFLCIAAHTLCHIVSAGWHSKAYCRCQKGQQKVQCKPVCICPSTVFVR